MGLHGMVANALAAAGVGQPHTRRMEETVLDMPVEEELVVSGDDVCINIIDAILRADHVLELVRTDGVMAALPFPRHWIPTRRKPLPGAFLVSHG